MFGFLGSIISSAMNANAQDKVNKYNQQNNDRAYFQNIAGNQTNNKLLHDLLGYDTRIGDTYSTSDMLNPYLAIENFKTSKDIAYNGAQIKANDYRKAGFNPLLAVGGSASFSPTSSNVPQSSAPTGNPLSNNNPFKISGGSDLLGYLSKSAEIKVLQAQANKLNAEAETEKGRPANLSADTDLKLQQTATQAAQEKLTLEQINTEMSKQHLNKSQIEKYNIDIKALQHDLNLSEKFDIKMSENIPYAWQQISNIIESIGVSPDNPLYSYLTLASIALLTASGSKVSFKSNKGSTKSFQEYSKNVPNNHHFTYNGKSYFKDKNGKISESIKIKEIN